MAYSYWELALYFFFYSFLGWLVEVGIYAIKEKRVCNRGILTLPLSFSYGISMVLLILLLPTLESNYIFQLLMALIVSSAVRNLANFLIDRLGKGRIPKDSDDSMFSGELGKSTVALLIALGFLFVYLLVHPVVFLAVHTLPQWLSILSVIVLAVLSCADAAVLLYVFHIDDRDGENEQRRREYSRDKARFGRRIYQLVWGRIERAYPGMEKALPGERCQVFAQGLCFDKLIWMFMICALLGDLIETLYCKLTIDVWMSRSSVIYGPFSIVWGVGAVLLTIVLQKVVQKDDRYVFLAGFFLGGAYEYLCSVFTEVFLGTVFWDYSDMPLNIGGRTNLLFCFFWGVLAVIWVKVCYPRLSGWIERVPPVPGKILTWIMLLFMICNILISAAAMTRYTDRMAGKAADNAVELFLDQRYNDALVEFVWPNLRIRDRANT